MFFKNSSVFCRAACFRAAKRSIMEKEFNVKWRDVIVKKDEILEYLKKSVDYVSGEDLSKKLGISRSAVWKNVNSLRESGYVIESVTNRGYRLADTSDVLNEREISGGLKTKVFGKKLTVFPEIDSTNEEAKRQALKGAEHGSVYVADQQLGGKGRLGRVWSSPPKTGLWFTVLLRPDAAPVQVSNLTLLAGLAVCRAIRSLTGSEAMIKWPNDIVIGSRKVCGILTEMTAEADRVHFAVVGIGVNVNNKEFSEELAVKATSLRMETGSPVSRVALLQGILPEFEALYNEYFIDGNEDWLKSYKKVCVSLNHRVGAERSGGRVTGTATDITRGGQLVVKCDDGSRIEINSGEVIVQGIYGQTC